jgi:hypothetical protein
VGSIDFLLEIYVVFLCLQALAAFSSRWLPSPRALNFRNALSKALAGLYHFACLESHSRCCVLQSLAAFVNSF